MKFHLSRLGVLRCRGYLDLHKTSDNVLPWWHGHQGANKLYLCEIKGNWQTHYCWYKAHTINTSKIFICWPILTFRMSSWGLMRSGERLDILIDLSNRYEVLQNRDNAWIIFRSGKSIKLICHEVLIVQLAPKFFSITYTSMNIHEPKNPVYLQNCDCTSPVKIAIFRQKLTKLKAKIGLCSQKNALREL